MNPKALLGILIGATLWCRVVGADEPTIFGVFANSTQSEAPINTAIESAAKELNFLIRPIARSRLKKRNVIVRKVSIDKSADAIRISLDDRKPTLAAPRQAPQKWTREDGEVFDVTTDWQGAALVQTFSASDGRRENRFSLGEDGDSLTMDVTLTSPNLKSPVRYRLSFARVKNP